MGPIDVFHFFIIGTGNKCYLDIMATQLYKEILYTRKIFVCHIFFKQIEIRSDLLPYTDKFSCKMLIINLCQSLSFNTRAEILHMQIFLSLLIPKDGILQFCVHDNAVKIK